MITRWWYTIWDFADRPGSFHPELAGVITTSTRSAEREVLLANTAVIKRRVNEVLKKTAVLVGATAGLMALAPIANADSADNDGVNVLNDNNLSVLPVQACNNDIAVLGAVVPILSPSEAECVNAPIADHPSAES